MRTDKAKSVRSGAPGKCRIVSMSTDDVGAEKQNSDAEEADAKVDASAEDKTVEIGKSSDAVAAAPPAAPKPTADKSAKGAEQPVAQGGGKGSGALVPIIGAFVAGV